LIYQLVSFLHDNKLLHQSQHGFTAGRSTVTNVLHFDAAIADIISRDHAYNIVSVDFTKAFDKAPHHHVLDALFQQGICQKAWMWFASFLGQRTQQVRLGGSMSASCIVTSGVIQGSTLGPVLFTIFTDSLLRLIPMPVVGYADDIKFLADVTVHTKSDVQTAIDALVCWSDDNNMPLSLPKTVVMHCGRHQPQHQYHIHGEPVMTVDSFVDLGVRRTSCATYSGHSQTVAAKASRVAGMIRRAFPSAACALRWPAFQSYVMPIIMYLSQAWHPKLKRDILLLEKVQQRFTKSIRELRGLTYVDRLRELQALTVANRLVYADMVFVHKCLYGKINVDISDLGLVSLASCTRANGCRLTQRHSNSKTSQLFCIRAACKWNKLPPALVSCRSLSMFKILLHNHLFLSQS
jgi:ribonuclease P/MRP protein subunit RPP40